MKVIFALLVSTAFILSCGNHKEKIVDEQIRIKKQLDSVTMLIDANDVVLESEKVIRDAEKRLGLKPDTPHWYGYDIEENQIDLLRMKGRLERRYDSLEMELKKY